MKFKYNLSKKNYEKIVRKTNSRNDMYYIIIGALVYLYFIKDLIMQNFWLMLVIYIVAVLIIYLAVKLVTFLTTKLIVKINEKSIGVKYGIYNCTLTKEKFTEKINDTEISILLKDVIKIKENKNSFEMMTKKMIIVFNRGLFDNINDYDKAVAFVKENITVKKKEA